MPKQSRLVGALSLVIAQGVVLVLGYITHPLIGRYLGPASYGIYGLVLSLQSILGLLLTLGVPVAVSRFVAQSEDRARSILWQGLQIQTIVAVVVSGLTLVSSRWIAGALGDPTLVNYVRFTAVVILLQAYYPLFVQYLSGLHHFNGQAILTSVYAITKLAGSLTLMYFFAVYGALAGFAFGGVVAALLGWGWTRRRGGRKPTRVPLQSFLQFAGVYVLILVGLQVLISLDLFMVKAILKDNVATGYYNAAVTLSRISYLLLQALAFILLPSVSALTRTDQSHDDAAAFIAQAIRYLIALIVPSVALAAATSRPLIALFFSAEYSQAAPVLTILMVGVGCIAFYLLLTNIVAGAGRATKGLLLTAGLVAVSATLGTILIPRYGLLGAAWQTTITGMLGLAILSWYTFYSFKIPVPWRSTINILIASAAAVVPTYLWQASPLTLVIQYAMAGILYLGALTLLGEITRADRVRVAGMHPSLRWVGRLQ